MATICIEVGVEVNDCAVRAARRPGLRRRPSRAPSRSAAPFYPGTGRHARADRSEHVHLLRDAFAAAGIDPCCHIIQVEKAMRPVDEEISIPAAEIDQPCAGAAGARRVGGNNVAFVVPMRSLVGRGGKPNAAPPEKSLSRNVVMILDMDDRAVFPRGIFPHALRPICVIPVRLVKGGIAQRFGQRVQMVEIGPGKPPPMGPKRSLHAQGRAILHHAGIGVFVIELRGGYVGSGRPGSRPPCAAAPEQAAATQQAEAAHRFLSGPGRLVPGKCAKMEAAVRQSQKSTSYFQRTSREPFGLKCLR